MQNADCEMIRQPCVGGGILDAPSYGDAACKWGVKDAAPYARETILYCKKYIMR